MSSKIRFNNHQWDLVIATVLSYKNRKVKKIKILEAESPKCNVKEVISLSHMDVTEWGSLIGTPIYEPQKRATNEDLLEMLRPIHGWLQLPPHAKGNNTVLY